MPLQKILAGYHITAQATLESTKAQTALSAVDTASSGSSGLSGGAIAGIVIGCIVGVLLLAAAAYFVVRHRQRRQAGRAGMKTLRFLIGEGQLLPMRSGSAGACLR